MGWATHLRQAEGQEPGALCAVGRAVLTQWEAAQGPAFKVILAYVSFRLERDAQISSGPSEVLLPLLSPGTLPHGYMGPLLHAHLAPSHTLQEDGLC